MGRRSTRGPDGPADAEGCHGCVGGSACGNEGPDPVALEDAEEQVLPVVMDPDRDLSYLIRRARAHFLLDVGGAPMLGAQLSMPLS